MILCEECKPNYWWDDEEFESCPKCSITELEADNQNLAQDCKAMINEIAAMQAKLDAVQWQPIETAPKDETLIDVLCECPYQPERFSNVRFTDVSWANGGWCRIMDDGEDQYLEKPQPHEWKVTHWLAVDPCTPGFVGEALRGRKLDKMPETVQAMIKEDQEWRKLKNKIEAGKATAADQKRFDFLDKFMEQSDE